MNNWYTKGFKEGRTYACSGTSYYVDPEDYKPHKCGVAGELCQCTGQIYYTKLYNEGNKAGIAVNKTETTTSATGTTSTVQHQTYYTSSDVDANAVTTTTAVDETDLLIDEEGPFNKDNDPFNKYRSEAEKNQTNMDEARKKAKEGPSLLQLSEEGPFNATSNPFEQFRNPPSRLKQPMSFTESLNWKFKVLTPPGGSLMCGASVMGYPHPGQKM